MILFTGKHPEQANLETGSRSMVSNTGGGEGQWEVTAHEDSSGVSFWDENVLEQVLTCFFTVFQSRNL